MTTKCKKIDSQIADYDQQKSELEIENTRLTALENYQEQQRCESDDHRI